MRFDTSVLPEHERFAAFREGFSRYVAAEITQESDGPFHASLAILRVGAISLLTAATSPSRFKRSTRELSDGDDALSVIICQRGCYRALHLGQDETLRPGDGILCDHGNVADIRVVTDSQRCSLKIPRARLRELAPQMGNAVGRKFAKNSPALRLMSHYFRGAQSANLVSSEPLTALFEEHAIHLAAHLLGVSSAAREVVENGGVRQARLRAVLHEIESRHGQPELNAAMVAERLGVTPRYVHRLLEETGKTFSECVLQRRLAAAMDLLRNPRQNRRKIVDIALEAGFADISHFNRSFRRQYGDTPSGARRLARRDEA